MGHNQRKQPLGTDFGKYLFGSKVDQHIWWNVLTPGLVQQHKKYLVELTITSYSHSDKL